MYILGLIALVSIIFIFSFFMKRFMLKKAGENMDALFPYMEKNGFLYFFLGANVTFSIVDLPKENILTIKSMATTTYVLPVKTYQLVIERGSFTVSTGPIKTHYKIREPFELTLPVEAGKTYTVVFDNHSDYDSNYYKAVDIIDISGRYGTTLYLQILEVNSSGNNSLT